MQGGNMIYQSETMVCPFCLSKRMFNCQRVVREAGAGCSQADEMAAWRCYACNVKILVTNFSYLPDSAKRHANSSVIRKGGNS